MMVCIWEDGIYNIGIGDPECKDLNKTLQSERNVEPCPTVNFVF